MSAAEARINATHIDHGIGYVGTKGVSRLPGRGESQERPDSRPGSLPHDARSLCRRLRWNLSGWIDLGWLTNGAYEVRHQDGGHPGSCVVLPNPLRTYMNAEKHLQWNDLLNALVEVRRSGSTVRTG